MQPIRGRGLGRVLKVVPENHDVNSLYLDENFQRKGSIDFMFGRFKLGDRATVIYIVSRNNMIEEY